MTGAELKTLREGLGLPVVWLAKAAGVRDRTVNYWESGHSAVPADVAEIINRLEKQVGAAVSGTADLVREKRPGEIALLRYKTEADLWKYRSDMQGMPVTFHAAMTFRALRPLEAAGVRYRIVYMEPEVYEAWRDGQNLPDTEGTRAAWAALQPS